jgi:hypothetical protein
MLAVLGFTFLVNRGSAQNAHLEQRLDKPVTLDKGIDRKTPLKDALEFLSDRYDIAIRIDSAAFKERLKLDDVGNAPVHLPRISGVRLGLVLTLLAKQVNGSYDIKRDYIEIMPFQKGVTPKKSSETWQKASKRVAELLDKPIDVEGIGLKTPLKDALEFLADRYDVAIVLDYSAFKQGKKEVMIEDVPVTQPVQKRVKLGEVLKMLLKQVGASYEIIDGAIIVAPPKKKDSV